MALPPIPGYFGVTGRWTRLVIDGTDPGREPDEQPLVGLSLVFTADVPGGLVTDRVLEKMGTVDPIVCTTNADGIMVEPRNVAVGAPQGVYLVPADDPNRTPRDWTWTLTVTAGTSGSTLTRQTIPFYATSGGSKDISAIVQVPASPGTDLVLWQAAVTETGVNADRAEAARIAAEAVPAQVTLPAVNGDSKLLARPDWPGIVAWSGTVEPLASLEKDIFVDTALPDRAWFDTARYGFFSHYTYGSPTFKQTIYPGGTVPGSVSSLAADFNVAQFVADVQGFGAEYVTFTAWHYAMNLLYPSAVMNTYRPGHSASRDVIQELIDAFAPTGIRFVPYIHLTDGHDMNAADQAATGWNDATGGYKAWNDFIVKLLLEFNLRYGKSVAGMWVDMVFDEPFQTKMDKPRLRKALLKGNPSRVIIGNGRYDNVAPSIGGGAIDYASQEYYPYPPSINDWVASDNQIVPLASNTGIWWATRLSTGASAIVAPTADLFRFAVLDIAVNRKGGGIAYNAGPYAGAGQLWEPGVKEAFTALWSTYIMPVKASLIGTKASARFPKTNTATLNNIGTPGWVATTKLDDTKEYIHVLNPPTSGTSITLPLSVGGAYFPTARLLATGIEAGVTHTPTAVTLTLPSGGSWDAVDTVVELTPATMVLNDSFTRPDSTALGTVELGGMAWQTQGAGTTGNGIIEGNALGFSGITGGAPRFVVVDSGVNANFEIEAVLKTRPANLRPRFDVLYGSSGAYEYLVSGDGAGKWKLEKAIGSTVTLLTTSTIAVTSGDRVRVKLVGTTITASINGTVFYTGTVDPAIITANAKGVGFSSYLDAMETRWDSIAMWRL